MIKYAYASWVNEFHEKSFAVISSDFSHASHKGDQKMQNKWPFTISIGKKH